MNETKASRRLNNASNLENLHLMPKEYIDSVARMVGISEEDVRDFETVELLAVISDRVEVKQ